MSPSVIVVGGGPAGAAAAITAANLGVDVTVIDKAAFPRDKTCGDGLTATALRYYEQLGLEPRTVPSWTAVRETVIVSPSGRTIALPLPRTGLFAAVTPRAELDAAFLDVARKAGAEVIDGDAVTGVDNDDTRVRVHTASGAVRTADYVVAADGMYSTVRKLVTGDGHAYLGEIHAFRQYFSGVDDDRIWVIFEPDVVPGYVWIFPLGGGRANVGFGIHRDGTPVQAMKQQWPDLLSRPSVRRVLDGAVPESPHRAWPIPAALDRAELARGRVLFAGDAASATDPLTGEGIAQALITGRRAAEAIAACGFDPAAVGARYRNAVAREVGRDLRFARSLLRVLRTPAGTRAAVRAAGVSDWTRRQFARWLFEDYPRGLLLTPSRWHRGAMSADGAYRES